MDFKYIEQLLERYWQCETSLEEEAQLRTNNLLRHTWSQKFSASQRKNLICHPPISINTAIDSADHITARPVFIGAGVRKALPSSAPAAGQGKE